jgi:hypothetical protein
MKKKTIQSWEQPCISEFMGVKRNPVHSWYRPYANCPYMSCIYCEASMPIEVYNQQQLDALTNFQSSVKKFL